MSYTVLSSRVPPELLRGQTLLTIFLHGLVASSENILIKHADHKNVGVFFSEGKNAKILHQSRSDFFFLRGLGK